MAKTSMINRQGKREKLVRRYAAKRAELKRRANTATPFHDGDATTDTGRGHGMRCEGLEDVERVQQLPDQAISQRTAQRARLPARLLSVLARRTAPRAASFRPFSLQTRLLSMPYVFRRSSFKPLAAPLLASLSVGLTYGGWIIGRPPRRVNACL